MPITFNINQLELGSIRLEGELGAEEFGLGDMDELVRPEGPVGYRFEVFKRDSGFLVEGVLRFGFRCECVRCLKPFQEAVVLDPWSMVLSREGEEAVVVEDDFVDLTPYLREDMVLAFPQHPLCEPGCIGLPVTNPGNPQDSRGGPSPTDAVSPWAELDKLKL